jgi:hypothetical protein
MKSLRTWILLGVAIAGAGAAWPAAACSVERVSWTFAGEALSPGAIAAARSAGAAGVEALLAAAPPPAAPARGAWERGLDAVCAQRDCAASGLYWYTDLDLAREEAARSGRPILSLRLLGRLDEELSCANSRFFRTVLYADPWISKRLRERFVLHWESVRPAPRLTIEFGDGRTLEGTITGNSIHYVLDARGRLVDALPGLYGPGMFLGALTRAESVAREVVDLDGPAHLAALAGYHGGRLAELDRALAREGGLAAALRELPRPERSPGLVIPAEAAMAMATTKSLVEQPVVSALARRPRRPKPAVAVDWAALAERHRAAWTLRPESREVLLRKHRPATPEEGERVIAGFEGLVGLDSVRNEYLLHAVLHRWLSDSARSGRAPDLAVFNDRVYAELFLTPGSDPWLGLVSPETYLALEAGGIGAVAE